MADSRRNSRGKSKENNTWRWICVNSKRVCTKCSVAIKSIFDWLRSHPIVFHLLAIVVVVASLMTIAHVAMTLGTRHNAHRTVPNFVGLTVNDAEHFAMRRDLNIVVNDTLYVATYPGGVVLEQLPTEGVIVKPGRKIYVTVNSLYQRKAAVPYVAGRSLRQAKTLLETAGFTIAHLDYVEDIATNYVLAEFVNGQEVVEPKDSVVMANVGSGVVLQVGVKPGNEAVVTPNVLGYTLTEAKDKLWEMGLNVGELSFDHGITMRDRDTTKVYHQSIFPNEKIKLGDAVSLSLTLSRERANEAVAEYERYVAAMLREQFVADSIAQAEKHLLDSIIEAGRTMMPVADLQSQTPQTEEVNF